jgi:lysyl-tRNA synthetase class 2
MMLKRVMGKPASLAATRAGSSGLSTTKAWAKIHNAFKHWDLGDIVAATGTLFKTKTGELSIHATRHPTGHQEPRPCPTSFTAWPTRRSYRQLCGPDHGRGRAPAVHRRRSAASGTSWWPTTLEVETRATPSPVVLMPNRSKPPQRARPGNVPAHRARLYLKRLIVGGLADSEINRSYRNRRHQRAAGSPR